MIQWLSRERIGTILSGGFLLLITFGIALLIWKVETRPRPQPYFAMNEIVTDKLGEVGLITWIQCRSGAEDCVYRIRIGALEVWARERELVK